MTDSIARRMAALFMLALLLWPLSSDAAGKKVFLHLKTGITQDDNQMCVAFNIALAAVQAGDQVEMFFDAAAVFDLQNASAEGASSTSQPASQPTTSDKRAYNLRYELPDKLKAILSAQFGIPKAQLPQDYYEYLQMLKDKGVEVTFNGAMAHLVSLSDSVKGKEKLADIATPLDLREVVQHREQAAVYFVY
jgi:predicted peroxiredoxin